MSYVIATQEHAQQPIVSIRDRRPRMDLPEFIGKSFSDLFGRLGLLGVDPAGPPFVIYHEFGPDEIDAEVCVPIAQPVSVTTSAAAATKLHARVLPAATVAGTLHVGPYEELGNAYTALTDWIHGNGLEAAGPLLERYLNGPGDVVTPADYRTEVELPIVHAAVAVPV